MHREQDLIILQMNSAHYEELLKLSLDDTKRSTVERLLIDCRDDLVVAKTLQRPKKVAAPQA